VTSSTRGGLAGPVSGGAHASRPQPAASGVDPSAPPVTLGRDLLDGLAEAVVATDPHGVVCLLNAAAERLLPELATGGRLDTCGVVPLARAVTADADTFDGEHRGRRLRGRRRDGAQGRSVWYVRDITEQQARTDALLAERSRSAFLADAGTRLGLSLHPVHTMRTMAVLAVPYLADAVVVVRDSAAAGPDGRLRWFRYAQGDPAPVPGTAPAGLACAVPGLVEALDGEAVEPSPWLSAELSDLGSVLPDGFGRPGTVLVTPLPGAGDAAGALVAVRRADRPGFDQPDVELFRQFAGRAGAALATAELYAEQARLAQVLQDGLLPPVLPEIPGAVLVGGYRAAEDTLRIGGDFYEVFVGGSTSGRRLAEPPTGGTFALGDVCGKGVDAAVLSGRVRQSLHTLRLVERRPRRTLELLNQALFNAPDAAVRSQFTTLLLGSFSLDPAGGLALRIAGGGHPAPLVLRADGQVVPVPVGGMPVGAVPQARFAEVTLRLEPGELLLAHTDGVTEARGGPGGQRMFGDTRLRQAVAPCAGAPAAVVVDRLLQLVDDWLDGQRHDDIAVLAVQAPVRA
jgi:serine phosphatase RsbU (regulator of sigma subunit)